MDRLFAKFQGFAYSIAVKNILRHPFFWDICRLSARRMLNKFRKVHKRKRDKTAFKRVRRRDHPDQAPGELEKEGSEDHGFYSQKIFAIVVSILMHGDKWSSSSGEGDCGKNTPWLWLLTGAVIILLVIWYDLLVIITHFIGAVAPTTTLFIFGLIFLMPHQLALLHPDIQAVASGKRNGPAVSLAPGSVGGSERFIIRNFLRIPIFRKPLRESLFSFLYTVQLYVPEDRYTYRIPFPDRISSGTRCNGYLFAIHMDDCFRFLLLGGGRPPAAGSLSGKLFSLPCG